MVMKTYFLVTSVNAALGCWLGTVLICAVIKWIGGYSVHRSLFKLILLRPLMGLLLGIAVSLLLYEGVFHFMLLSIATGFLVGILVGSLIGKAMLPFKRIKWL
jgi:hypothetical protein